MKIILILKLTMQATNSSIKSPKFHMYTNICNADVVGVVYLVPTLVRTKMLYAISTKRNTIWNRTSYADLIHNCKMLKNKAELTNILLKEMKCNNIHYPIMKYR